MNKWDHIVTNKINNKNQRNDIIQYDPNFDIKFSFL